MIVIGGIQYMGDESVFGKTEAKNRIFSAILGLIIALGSYVLLNTINPDLLGEKGVYIEQATVELDPEVHGDNPQQPVDGKYCNGKYEVDKDWGDDETTRTALESKGIAIKDNGKCAKAGDTDCTSVTGLITTNIIELKNKCTSCEIKITGGTECWLHSNKTLHLPGNNIVDLRSKDSPNLVQYIEENNPIESTNLGPVYEKNGSKFLKETNHYHVIKW